MGCMELHDRMMVGVRTERLELDEAWSFVGKKQKNVLRHEINAKGDQYIFIGMAGTQKGNHQLGRRQAQHRKHDGFPARLAQPRDRPAGDFNGWLSTRTA